MNRKEKVSRRNVFRMENEKFSLGHREVLGLCKTYPRGATKAATGNPGLEFKSEVSKVKMQELFNDINERR